MNKNVLIPIIIIIAGAAIGGGLLLSDGQNNTTPSVNATQTDLRKVDLEISGMTCIGCSSSVTQSVKALPGVVDADADAGTASGWAIYDSAQTTKEDILAVPIFQVYPAKIVSDSAYTNVSTDRQ